MYYNLRQIIGGIMKKLIMIFSVFILLLAGCGSGSVDSEGDGVLTIWSFYEGAPKAAGLSSFYSV